MRQSVKNKIKIGIVYSPIVILCFTTGHFILPFTIFGFVMLLAWLVEW